MKPAPLCLHLFLALVELLCGILKLAGGRAVGCLNLAHSVLQIGDLPFETDAIGPEGRYIACGGEVLFLGNTGKQQRTT